MTITVITPIYNRANVFNRTLKSVVKELNENIRYFVVSDGSSDFEELREVVSEYRKFSNLELIELTENIGICGALNFGAKNSTTDWVMFLGSDDELLPNSMIEATSYLQTLPQEIDFVYYSMLYHDGNVRPNIKPPFELTYSRYLRHIDRTLAKDQELGILIRRESILGHPLPENHAFEDKFHLDINRDLRGFFSPLVLKKVNTDLRIRASNPSLSIRNSSDLIRINGQKIGFQNAISSHYFGLLIYSRKYLISMIKKIIRRSLTIARSSPKFYFSVCFLIDVKFASFLFYEFFNIFKVWKLISQKILVWEASTK